MIEKKYFQISEFASLVGVTPKALRMYESLGLLESHRKALSNYRYYSEDAIFSVDKIKRMKNLGFTLKEIQKILSTSNDFDLEDFKMILREQYQKAEMCIKEMGNRKKAISNIIRTIESSSDEEALSRYERDIFMKMSTGFSKIDHVLNDLPRDQLIIIAGRPGMGKTSLSLQMAYNFAEITNKKAVIISKQMSHEEFEGRIVTTMAEIRAENSPYRKEPVNEEDKQKLEESRKRLEKNSTYHEQISDLSISKIIDVVNKQYEELGLIVIDYFQDIDDVISKDVFKLKELARQHNCPIILISTINADVDNREIKRPHLRDVNDYSLLREVSDIFMIVYRDSFWNKSSPSIAEIDVYKNSDLPESRITLTWNGEYCGYKE